jgi:flagellar hook-associated protein 2
LGVGSGADLTTLLNNLMTAEKIPLVSLQKKEAAQQAKITAYGTLSSALAAFSTATAGVNEAKFNTAKATSSDAAVATVTSKLGAATGNLSLKVDALATNAKVASARVLDSDNLAAKSDSTIGTGTLTFTMGTATSSPAGFTADSERETITVDITSANASLEGIRDAVNAKGGAISASIVNDGAGARLVFSSNATGVKNNFKIEANGPVGGNGGPGLAQFAFDPATPGNAATAPSQITYGADAAFSIDGMAITNPNNTLTDVIDGLTITLLKAGVNNGVASTTTIGVAQDNTAAKSAVQSLATAYNALLASTKTLSLSVPQDAGSDDARTDGPLSGDATIRSLMNQIKTQMMAPMDGATEPYTSLSTIGMEFQKDGTLKLNETVFDKAMSADRAAVTKLFTDEPNGEGSQGITAKLAATVSQMTGSDGQVQSRIDSVTTITKQLQKQQTDMSARLVQIEARYRAQFTALDTMLTSLDSTSTFLTQQLDALADMRRQ